jgi:thioredoxin-dependent peroxiredoxin
MALLKIGDPAPLFEGKDQNGKTIALKNYLGNKIILYFYPKDMTPGCTDEACNLRDNYSLLLKKGFVVLGVSADDEESHRKFIGMHKLPFPLIADTDRKIINAYGAWGEKNNYGKKYEGILRTTYVIDEKGKIEEVFAKVDTKDHTQQILGTLKI